jgi:hypothetical protein
MPKLWKLPRNSAICKMKTDTATTKTPTTLLQSGTRGKIPSLTSSSSSSRLVGHLATARTVKRSAAKSGLARTRIVSMTTPILLLLSSFCYCLHLSLCQSNL